MKTEAIDSYREMLEQIANNENLKQKNLSLSVNKEYLSGLLMIDSVDKYANNADYDALIQNDDNGELLRLIGKYMTLGGQERDMYAYCVLRHISTLVRQYWSKIIDKDLEKASDKVFHQNKPQDWSFSREYD